MKKVIAAFILILSLNAHAQQYVPFPTDSARWKCVFSAWTWSCASGVPPHGYEYSFCGDTLIGATTYHKVCSIGWTADANCFTPPTGYIGCIREDSGKHVFFRPVWLGSDTLLYDFNVQVGDTLRTYNNGCLEIVATIDSILIGSTYRKQYHMSGDFWCGNIQRVIIEGIGSSSGLFEEFGQYQARHDLVCFADHDQTLYPVFNSGCAPLVEGITEQDATQLWTAAPNPSIGTVTLTSSLLTENSEYTVTLWNLSGERVSVQSCYSQNGNIMVARYGIAEGTYFAEIRDNQQSISRIKIIFLGE